MYKIFEQLLQRNNVTAYRVAKDIGVPAGTFTNWKMGRSTPKQDKLKLIADYFNVTLEYLMGTSESEVDSSEKKRLETLINIYPVGSMKALSKLCKAGRINKDMTERNMALNIGIDLEEYLEFENNYKNIGAEYIVKLLTYHGLDVIYITGFLTGMLINADPDSNETAEILESLNFGEGFKKEIEALVSLKAQRIQGNNKMLSPDDDVEVYRGKLDKIIDLINDKY